MLVKLGLVAFLALGLCLAPAFAAETDRTEDVRQLAANGDADSQYRLAMWHFWAVPPMRDFDQAVYWFCQAAAKGHRPSQIQLGMMHWTGNGIPRNPVHAFVWFDLASRTAGGIAEEYRDRVAKDYLTPRDIETARALADSWAPARQCPLRSSGT